MSKKAYFPPVLTFASGGIDITQSQEGSIGTGTEYSDLWAMLNDQLDDDARKWLTSQYGSRPGDWTDDVEGFDPDNPETWELILEFVYNGYYGG